MKWLVLIFLLQAPFLRSDADELKRHPAPSKVASAFHIASSEYPISSSMLGSLLDGFRAAQSCMAEKHERSQSYDVQLHWFRTELVPSEFMFGTCRFECREWYPGCQGLYTPESRTIKLAYCGDGDFGTLKALMQHESQHAIADLLRMPNWATVGHWPDPCVVDFPTPTY